LPAIATLRGIREDIGIVPMHGHTRGHSAVIAKSGDRWLVHAGDAYFARASVTGGKAPFGLGMFERAMQMDGAARRASVGALAQLRKSYEDVELFCAHDAAEYDSVTA
jgi:glyoxylase-like metal-dependent hydrolase (beta-lactamase superfamily II)